MKNRKKIFAAALSAFLTIGCLLPSSGSGYTAVSSPVSSSAADNNEVVKSGHLNGLSYDLYPDHAEITYCSRVTEGEVVVPDTIEGQPVTVIQDTAFTLCEKITAVTLPETITYIGLGAFQHCYEMESINIPENVEHIGERAFLKCYALKEITLPEKLTVIEGLCFFECSSLEKAEIPPNVTTIENEAFAGCASLPYAHIPESVEHIGWRSFARCSGITEVSICDTTRRIDDDAFMSTGWYDALPDGLVYLGKVLYEYKGYPPERSTVRLKDDTIAIAGGAFFDCHSLIEVVLPEGLERISAVAFEGCTNLKEVELPQSLKIIGDGSFANTGLTHIELPENIENIGSEAFAYCPNLVEVTMPEHTSMYIQSRAFHDTAWYNAQPDGLIYLSKLAYTYKGTVPKDTVITLKNGTTGICESAFYGQNGLKGINIPNTVKYIGTAAFSCCPSITSVEIPESVETICKSAFSSCASLESVTIANPECSIYDSQYTICNEEKKSGESHFDGTIRGKAHSVQEAYAEEYGYKYYAITESMLNGDANCDGFVDIADATAILQAIGNPDKYALSQQGSSNADVCGYDGVTALDSLVVQMVDSCRISVSDLPLADLDDINDIMTLK